MNDHFQVLRILFVDFHFAYSEADPVTKRFQDRILGRPDPYQRLPRFVFGIGIFRFELKKVFSKVQASIPRFSSTRLPIRYLYPLPKSYFYSTHFFFKSIKYNLFIPNIFVQSHSCHDFISVPDLNCRN